MPSTITLPWLRLLIFFSLLLPTAALGSRLEMRQDTLPDQQVQMGQAPTPTAKTEPKRRTDPLALVSLGTALIGNIWAYWGLVSLAVLPLVLLWTFGAVALITGLISQARIKRRKQSLKGKGWALAGIGIGVWLIQIWAGFMLIHAFFWWLRTRRINL